VSNASGRLFVVATPIGNQGDISTRACEILAQVDAVAAEDTRHSGRLLSQLGIRQRLISVHEHNEASRIESLLEQLRQGEDIALISDAGTPLISDPGFRLVRAARRAGVEVLSVPGPSSIIAALSVAGLPSDRFVYEGFLPARSSARVRRLEALAGLEQTLILLEAGRRVPETLADLIRVMGAEREAALCRELTKRFETTYTDTLAAVADWVAADADRQRGEFVLLVAAGESSATATQASVPPVADILRMLRDEGLGAKAAARVAARLTGESANALYGQASQAGFDDSPPR
jgi:16S rRNA (cytidine1402-2'-O)-methyltransferase